MSTTIDVLICLRPKTERRVILVFYKNLVLFGLLFPSVCGAQLNQFVTDEHIDWTARKGHLQQALLAGFNYVQSNDTWGEIDGVDPVTLDLLHPNYHQTFDLPAPDFISALSTG
jgi:hypothetical protein